VTIKSLILLHATGRGNNQPHCFPSFSPNVGDCHVVEEGNKKKSLGFQLTNLRKSSLGGNSMTSCFPPQEKANQPLDRQMMYDWQDPSSQKCDHPKIALGTAERNWRERERP
jgi:hypothetical protein